MVKSDIDRRIKSRLLYFRTNLPSARPSRHRLSPPPGSRYRRRTPFPPGTRHARPWPGPRHRLGNREKSLETFGISPRPDTVPPRPAHGPASIKRLGEFQSTYLISYDQRHHCWPVYAIGETDRAVHVVRSWRGNICDLKGLCSTPRQT